MKVWVIWKYIVNKDSTIDGVGDCVGVRFTAKGAARKVAKLQGKKIYSVYRTVEARLGW